MSIYSNEIINLINEVEEKEEKNINEACEIIYKSMKNDGVVHVFATGHSHMFAEELFYRAGGLVQVNPILEPFLMQHEGAVRSTQFERVSGIAQKIFDSINLKENEPFICVRKAEESVWKTRSMPTNFRKPAVTRLKRMKSWVLPLT